MSAGELVDMLVMMVVVMGTERVREAHQPPQGASELGVRMLEDPTVHARPGCGGAEVKMQREAVWLNMQSKKVGERRKKRRRHGGGGGGGGDGAARDGRREGGRETRADGRARSAERSCGVRALRGI